jgi:hypothetical protein
VILLDHNIPRDQADRLRRWRVRFSQIGFEIGRPEWEDQQEVLRLLHRLKLPTFFTRDVGFYRAECRHRNYCIAVLDGLVLDTATDIRRFLREPRFRTRTQRSGCVAKVRPTGVTWWAIGQRRPMRVRWSR